MTVNVTLNILKAQLTGINILLDVQEGAIGYCYLSSISRPGLPYLYQVQQIINEAGDVRDFLSTGNVQAGILSKAMAAFSQGFRLALTGDRIKKEIDKILEFHHIHNEASTKDTEVK
ncbi:MAG: hypothetical protein K5Q00_05010 [Gammaproteobacteria bacterium]|nr:hypothetical protein [Gammaproteobacteria bacterium]